MGKRKVIEQPKKKISKSNLIITIIIVAMVFSAAGIIAYSKMDTYSKLNYDKILELGKYKGLKGSPAEVSVTKKDVQSEIKERLEKAAKEKAVKSGEVKDGDTIIIDYKGMIDGEPFDGGTASEQELEIGSGTMIEGFEKSLIGKSVGEKCSINVTFPDDYTSKNLAGKDATFKVKIRSKKITVVPKYNTAFVKSVSKYTNKKDYEKSVKKELLKKAKQESWENFETELWGKVTAKTKVKEYPKELLSEEIKNQKVQYEQMAQQYGMTAKQLGVGKKEFRQYAKEALKEKLTMKAIAKKEHLRVKKKDREEFYKKFLEETEMTEKQFEKGTGMSVEEYVRENGYEFEILKTVIMDYIAESAVSQNK